MERCSVGALEPLGALRIHRGEDLPGRLPSHFTFLLLQLAQATATFNLRLLDGGGPCGMVYALAGAVVGI